jgi:tetratricopeptide (TPR) repeat protein
MATAAPLDDSIVRFEKQAQADEPTVLQILKDGMSENRSARAFAATRTWLNEHPDSSATLTFHAGQAAERAGEWTAAVSFYRKLAQSPDANAEQLAPAVPAAYRLLIHHLKSTETAYLMMREDGSRLRQYGDAKRFDFWFLDQASRRTDLAAMAERLAVVLDSDDPVEPYQPYFAALFDELETYQHGGKLLYQALDQLADAKRSTPAIKARIEWIKEIEPLTKMMAEHIASRKEIPGDILDVALNAAGKLVTELPYEGSLAVAKGWMNFNHGDTPTFRKFIAIRRAEKAAPLLWALAGMKPAQVNSFLSHQVDNARDRRIGDFMFSSGELLALAARLPEIFNSLEAPKVPLIDSGITLEEAQQAAPHLARNPHIEAALVRLIASGKRNYPDAVDAAVQSEAWRFKDIEEIAKQIWNNPAFERAGEQGAPLKKYKDFGASYQKLANQVANKANSQQRLQAFESLLNDLSQAAPRIPGALALWGDLFKQSPDADTVAMLDRLIEDLDDERTWLLQRALDQITFGKSGRMPWQAEVQNNHQRYHQKPTQEAAAELIAKLGKALEEYAAKGEIPETLFGMWLHSVDPDQEVNRKRMRLLADSKAWQKLDAAYRNVAIQSQYFGHAAVSSTTHPLHPAAISRELLALDQTSKPDQVEKALNRVMTLVSAAHKPVTVIGLAPVAELPEWSTATRQNVLSLFGELAPVEDYPSGQGYEPLVTRLANGFEEAGFAGIEPYAAGLWRATAATDNGSAYAGASALTIGIRTAIEAKQYSVAMTLARSAKGASVSRQLAESGRDNLKDLWATITQAAGEATIEIGAVEIPVPENDPLYPIYKSNTEFIKGNLDAAWMLFEKNAERLPEVMRKLSPEYGLWLLERYIAADETDAAEELVKELTVWSRQQEGLFSAEQEAQLRISYADLAFRKGALPTARALYRRIADAAEYQGTENHLRAALGSVLVDRVSKNFSAALEELDKLMRLKNPAFRIRVRYARAEVLMDQENYADALGEVEAVLRSQPKHPDALILRGKIHYQMRKLVEASEIELGPSQTETVLVPGESLKINLRDPSLRVSGLGADIEVEIRAKSGDVERLLLYQLGDSKEKFRAEIPTALGAARKNDKVLQILGKDEIRFGYSQRFRERMDDLPPDPDTVITVASDAYMALSAGAFPPRAGERRLNIEELGLTTAQAALGTRTVRPGNPIYLRIIDSDRSETPDIDTLQVDITTTSGDSINNLSVQETKPFSGEFEVVIPTAPAQAIAFASDSAPGTDPNMAISSRDYPGWQGQVKDNDIARSFGVDLNDNVGIYSMEIVTGDEAQSLTHFVLQTSLNGKDWATQARFPENPAPWNGSPQLTSIPTYRGGAIPISTPEDYALPGDWHEAMELGSASPEVTYMEAYVEKLNQKDLPVCSTGHPGYPGLFRYRAMFYQPAAAIRTFQLKGLPGKDDKGNITTIFLLNGEPAEEDSESHLTIRRELKPGLHTLEFWCHIGRDDFTQAIPQILCDAVGQEKLVPCPPELFDPSRMPDAIRAELPQPAMIEEAGNALRVQFGDNTQARMVRLSIHGFKGVAPKIQKLTLKDRTGDAVLPVEQDYQQLRQNQQLEVLPGDRIIARYVDPVSATPKRNRQQKSLGVAFNSGTITASFLNYELNKEGERELVLEAIRRFRLDDAIAIVIDDADLDASPQRDVVEFTVRSSSGNTAILKALETEEHSGQFMGRVFPVEGEPARSSEIQITQGGTLTAIYRDTENLDPGIPIDREVTISHAQYVEPALDAYAISTELIEKTRAPTKDTSRKPTKSRGVGQETIPAHRSLSYQHVPDEVVENTELIGLIGADLYFDLIAPHLALAKSSEINAYVQTEAARRQANIPEGKFDLTVPGTLKLTGGLKRMASEAPDGYILEKSPKAPTQSPPLEEGRFSFSLPLILGDPPARSFATKSAEELPSSAIPDGLAVKAGDIIHVAYPWQDPENNVKWRYLSYEVRAHAMLDVMQNGYKETLHHAFVGEKVHLRLIAPGLDQSPGRDKTEVSLRGSSGAAAQYQLQETEPHSGIFKAAFTISYADEMIPAQLPPVALNGIPVRYGDTITVNYEDQSHEVSVKKGADGLIEPFSKRFTGDEMAVRTSFTLAECFFELAKKHREMQQESLARREIGQARKLLSEALATHHDEALKAHAEYLLGNLAQEFADLANNAAARLPMYQDALARFSKIPLDYPDSEFAPKAQFKTALVYEKMGEIENAVEEYVKLAYKYPDNELISTVMSRLGGYFQKKGQQYKEQADPLREKTDDAAISEVLRLDELSYPEFLNAAMVFAKLQERFPDDPLAGMAGLRAAQNLMRAHQYQRAIQQFETVIDNENYDDTSVRAQGVYWSGLCYERSYALMSTESWKGRGRSLNAAYQMYRRVTFDFPDSKWAKYARGRLADPFFANIIETERLGRERMIEALETTMKNRR